VVLNDDMDHARRSGLVHHRVSETPTRNQLGGDGWPEVPALTSAVLPNLIKVPHLQIAYVVPKPFQLAALEGFRDRRHARIKQLEVPLRELPQVVCDALHVWKPLTVDADAHGPSECARPKSGAVS
jgi:hypothetical protein